MNANARSGMTLIELLVVLAILASLAVSVVVSSSGMADRARVERTRRQGEAMREALERADGLSIVSDLGPLFDTETVDDAARDARNLALLGYLFCPSNVFDLVVGEDAEEPHDTGFKVVPAYALQTCELLPTNFIAQAGLAAGLEARFAAVTNGLGGVSLGCGWRGPYCRERVREADGRLRDGFGGRWECAVTATDCQLISRGQDRAEDGTEAAKNWKEQDQRFEVRTGSGLVTLAVSLDENGVEGGSAISNLYVFAYAPKLTIDDTADDRASVEIETVCHRFPNTSSASVGGLSMGERVFFVVGEDAANRFYAARPQRTILRPGVNELLKLKIVQRSE
ncbi:MAG: type II secretion system protein [Kiritimatiellia bacterium]